jgi:hypothetical protein
MKKIVLILALLLVGQSFAQQLKVKKSPVYEDNKKKSELATMLADKQGGVFAVRPYFTSYGSSKLGYYIEHYNRDLKLLKTYTYKLKRNADVAAVFVNDNKFFFVEYQKDNKAKKINVIANYTAINEMKFKQKTLFSFATKNVNSFYYDLINRGRKNASLLTNVSFSKDNKYGLFYFDMYNRKQETHRLYVLNNEMELVWKKQIKFPYKDRNFTVEDFQIANDGTAYILAKIHLGNVFSRSYHYELYKINADGLLGTLKFDDSKYYASSLKIVKDKLDDTIAIVGFYSQYYRGGNFVNSSGGTRDYANGSYRIRGVCTFKIDSKKMKLTKQNFQKFSNQFIQDKYGKVRKDRAGRAKAIDVSNVVFRDVLFADNGDMVVAAEEMITVVSQTPISTNYSNSNYYANQNTSQNTTYSYQFGDAMIFRLDADGKLIWSRNINKSMRASSKYDPLASFSITASADNVYVFLTANKKLGKLSKGRKTFKGGFSGVTKYNSKMYAIKFDKMGKWTVKALVDNKQSDVIFYSKLGYRMPDNSIYFFGRFRHDKQLMHISF